MCLVFMVLIMIFGVWLRVFCSILFRVVSVCFECRYLNLGERFSFKVLCW